MRFLHLMIGFWLCQALGLKVKTGVKILEIQHGDDGMQGVKIEKDGTEDRWTDGGFNNLGDDDDDDDG